MNGKRHRWQWIQYTSNWEDIVLLTGFQSFSNSLFHFDGKNWSFWKWWTNWDLDRILKIVKVAGKPLTTFWGHEKIFQISYVKKVWISISLMQKNKNERFYNIQNIWSWYLVWYSWQIMQCFNPRLTFFEAVQYPVWGLVGIWHRPKKMVWGLDWVWYIRWEDWIIIITYLLSIAIQYTTNDPEMIFYLKCYRGGIFLITVVVFAPKIVFEGLSLLSLRL